MVSVRILSGAAGVLPMPDAPVEHRWAAWRRLTAQSKDAISIQQDLVSLACADSGWAGREFCGCRDLSFEAKTGRRPPRASMVSFSLPGTMTRFPRTIAPLDLIDLEIRTNPSRVEEHPRELSL
jgi:hypothetical protein